MSVGNAMQLSERLQVLKSQVRSNYDAAMFAHRREVYERVWRDHPTEAAVLQAARGLAGFLAEKNLMLTPEDLLAGGEQFYDFTFPAPCWNGIGDRSPISLAVQRTMEILKTPHAAPANQQPGQYPGPAAAQLTGNQERGVEFTPPTSNLLSQRALLLDEFCQGYRIGRFSGGLGGHVIAGYHRVLEQGLGALAAAAARRMEEATGDERDFAEASWLVCTAASNYAWRYALKARSLLQDAATDEGRDHLRRIAVACERVATEPAYSFFEALQLVWLTHEIITCEQESGSLSLGRLDQVLYPYYRRDIDAGRLTPQEAAELAEAFWAKFAGIKRGFQNVTLGGSDGRGHDLTNELSFIFLRATHKLRMDQPLISVRCHPGMPESFWNEIEELLQQGMGFPALFNEQVVSDAKVGLGVDRAEVYDWGIVGCVEPSIPGREFAHTEALRINWAKVLELMLNDGRCTVSGEVAPLQERRDLASITSFADFYGWYRRELAHAVDHAIRSMVILDETFARRFPYPFLSSTMEGCLQAGRDVTAGSTIYNLCTVNGLGMANVADALVAIKRLVFEQHLVSLPALAQALRDDFAGQEALRQALLRCPKYGNDQSEPDRILQELAGDFHRQISGHRNGRGGRIQCGMYTVDSHGYVGKLTGALPDGRRRGVALANALSPSQGADLSGPTAVIRSCTRLNHRQWGNGMVLDIKFAPTFFAEMRRQGIFRPLVETYFRSGGMEIQFNIIDRATLRAAQRSPQDYRDLIVRVSGFSAYFVDLEQVIQNEIIARTEHAAL